MYLLGSLNFCGRHGNEAFSSLKIQDYKNFLRLHIDRQGGLLIYPIGLTRVPRAWKPAQNPRPGDALLVPTDGELDPHLIERPIRIKPRSSESAGILNIVTPDSPSAA